MSLPRYPQYKDSEVAWLGQVPAHWQVRRLGFYFDERREKVSDKDYPALSVTKAGIVPQLETAAKTDDGDNRKKVCTGDFVINSRSDRKGSAGMSRLDGSVSLINTVLQPTSGIDIEFAHHLLRSVPFQEEFYRYGKGIVADLWSTNYSEMRNIVLALPSLEEQAAIAALLDRETGKIDALIAEQEKLLALLAEKRLATISHAVTRGLSPDAQTKDSGVAWLGEVPAHWDVTRLKFVASVQTGIAKGKDTTGKETITVPYLRVANVQDGFLALDDIATIDIEPEQLDRYRLQAGDVLMNEGGDFDKLGRGAIWCGQIQDCIHQNHVFAVRPHGVDARWLNQITSSQYAQYYFMGRSKQSTNLASISSSNIMELPVLMPPTQEQGAILAFIDAETSKLDNLRAEAERAIDLLKERRSALIAAAVTGKIDVRGVKAQNTNNNEELAA
ncbi:type I restriction endonuclease subunit S [Burkholderia pseudomallei]|uniref:restriction endonuclease subunit S n=1 Tax=Burkholderia pseudomallei TaxID=28450 RepID=UPI000536EAAE|nr:restriction endonuclease subunit S [Burkholderia pseudomallei]AJX21684.1 type I restriction modification DNA specificity domain protein [Burkholderia pseudomallei MSHR491]KGW83151.1 type I restriction modification DNA specificity domain protein [Burkholderia pseudomallei MSHR449]KGX74250.1 type I restriction modification DNA specificity domain protein [Burkholderia pseudomallei MSHR435]ONC06115.1 type I restriction endonuclease subunit S [Burkholderia pseudomallei]